MKEILQKINDWIMDDLPDNIPAMCFIMPVFIGAGIAAALFMVIGVIKLLLKIG